MDRRDFLATSLMAVPAFMPRTPPANFNSVTTEVINAGIGGNTTADIMDRMENDCLRHHPELTVLMIGTNDMNSKKYIPLNKYVDNLQNIVTRMQQSKSQVLLMNLLPAYEPYLLTRHDRKFYAPEGHRVRLLQMNDQIQTIAKASQVPLLDLFHLFDSVGNIGLDQTSLLKNEANSGVTDGLHPTPDGYRFIALAVYDAIRQHNLPQGKIVCLGDSITYGDGKTNGQNYPAYLSKLLSHD